MLKIYAQAVKLMKGKWAGDPHSWTFQWYTHWVDGSTTKDDAIKAVFGNHGTKQKLLSEIMWNTCQGHGPNPVEYFLAWHRMFVFYFEQIIRNVTGFTQFTLPYWPYDEVAHRALPPEFRNEKSTLYGPLFVANRNPGNNEGQSIERYGPLDFSCMSQKSFLGPSDSRGFNGKLNQNPHGAVHDDVGTDTNMGQIPYAANDPVFWAHHCQIDRLWASWNAAGGKNPDDAGFKSKEFVFDDGTGQQVVAKIGDFLDESHLNYKYDTLMDIPPIESPMLVADVSGIAAFTAGAAESGHKHGAANNMLSAPVPGAITLGANPVRVQLTPNSDNVDAPMEMLMKTAPAVQTVILQLSDIYTSTSPGTSYGVYLNLPAGVTPEPTTPHYIGSINFFNATAMPGMDMMIMTDTFSFDITDKVKNLGDQGSNPDALSVTLSPFNSPNADSSPKVGRIEIVIE